MSRVLLLAVAVAAAIAMISATTPPPVDCTCRQGIACASSLENCAINSYTEVHTGPQTNLACNTPWFSCLESPSNCRVTANCSEPPPKCQCRHDIKCYRSEQDCRTYSGALTPESGSNADCLALGRPVFACWEEPDVCRRTRDCEVIIPGGGNQDPHFAGFDGSEYYFEGRAGQDYNIISDTMMQLNAHFIRLSELKGTYMGRLGLRFGDVSLTFDPHFGLFFNDTVMTNGEVDLPEGSFLVETMADQRMRFAFENDVYHITAAVAVEQGAHINVEQGTRAAAYINIKAALLGTPVNPHGILGQTARVAIPGADPLPRPFHVEGTEEDYHVRDGLHGTDFTFNRFIADEQPITVSAVRVRRGTAQAQFEASSK